MQIHRQGLYKVHHSSIYLRVLKLRYTNGVKAVYKLAFEYKNGTVIEVKNYTVQLKNIQHWIRVG